MIRMYEIAGECIPKGRPRFTKSGRVYTPTKTKQYEKKVQLNLQAQKAKPSDQPIKIDITIVKGYLKSWTKTQLEMAKNQTLLPSKKPDIDNYVKSILDASNRLLFNDDGQIVELTARKVYGETPKVIIEVQNLK